MVEKSIIITGGSGFIGTNLIDYYESLGYSILNIDIKPPRKLEHNVYWRQCDILDLSNLKKLVTDFNAPILIHMAAKADLKGKSIEDYITNTVGVHNIITVCNDTRSNVQKVVFASTMLVCKAGYIPKIDNDYCPLNFYGESKMMGEKLVKEANNLKFNWIIVRPSSIWGPWFGATYRTFFEMIIHKRYFNFSGRMSTKTFGYIGNVVYQIDQIINSTNSSHKTFYLGDYEAVNIKQWANEISLEIGHKVKTIPKFLVFILAKIGDFLSRLNINFPMNSFRYNNMTTDNTLPLDNTREIAPKTPFSRKCGIKITLEWMKTIVNQS